MNNLFKTFVFIFILGFLFFSIREYFNSYQKSSQEILYSDFLRKVSSGEITKVTIQKEEITALASSGNKYLTYNPGDIDLIPLLKKKSVKIESKAAYKPGILTQLIVGWLPGLLLIGLLFFMFSGKGAGNFIGIGSSRAKLIKKRKDLVTFADVAGIDECKEQLNEIVDFLKNPKKFHRLGAKIPKGCLLIGPPGTGKTLLGRAVAGEAKVDFFSASGSDFVEMFVGVGASRIRTMFEQAKKSAPCIVFIDEIDAVGRRRGVGLGGGNDEREQTLNQLLVEMDGFEKHTGIILLAATNRPEILDPALLRPGRFDRHINVHLPDMKGREEILKIHARNIPIASDVDLKILARGTPGFSGADLANILNEGCLIAAKNDQKYVVMKDFERAKDKIILGVERKSLGLSDEDKKLIAYHEGGHALLAVKLKNSDPVHKVTIIPRGRALGMVSRLPERDQFSIRKSKLEANIIISMAGRAAEEIIFGKEDITTGASSDIKYASNIARCMVMEWGMSDKLGNVLYGEKTQSIYSRTQHEKNSDLTEEIIDKEVRSILDTSYTKARKIIEENIAVLHTIAEQLLVHETITGEELKEIIEHNEILSRKKSGDNEKAMSIFPR